MICRNEEKLKATMTGEQKELFDKYADGVREYQTITDCLLFQSSFKLGARMMLEVMEQAEEIMANISGTEPNVECMAWLG